MIVAQKHNEKQNQFRESRNARIDNNEKTHVK